MDTSSVPLMMDMEEEEEDNHKSRGLEAGLENDFAYNNNVAGASKHVRLGENEIDDNEIISLMIIIVRIHEKSLWIVGGSTVNYNLDWWSLPFYSWCQGICPGNNTLH